ncbi:MAG: hypothetical protein MK135_00010 [Polyangiaceae bacterium]|nr:hypothetical protein [Polyangiaceae bacterium]
MTLSTRIFFSIFFFIISSCGYSQDAWDQKVRESEELRDRLAAERRSREHTADDYADALERIESLEATLEERGLSLEELNQDLAAQKSALEQLDKLREVHQQNAERVAALRARLGKESALPSQVLLQDLGFQIIWASTSLFETQQARLLPEALEEIKKMIDVIFRDPELLNYDWRIEAKETQKYRGLYGDAQGLGAQRASRLSAAFALSQSGSGDRQFLTQLTAASTRPDFGKTDKNKEKSATLALVARLPQQLDANVAAPLSPANQE